MMPKKRSSTSVHVDTDFDAKPPKRARPTDQSASATTLSLRPALPKTAPAPLHHPVLLRFYPQVLSLRHYLLSRLPHSSKTRLRKISQLGLPSSTSPSNPTNQTPHTAHPHTNNITTATANNSTSSCNVEIDLAHLLDHTLVGVSSSSATQSLNLGDQATSELVKDIETFSQQLSNCTTTAPSVSTLKPGYFQQSEIVDLVIWRQFKRSTSTNRPSHLLCHGFQRYHGPSRHNAAANRAIGNHENPHNVPPSSIPGLVSQYPNSAVTALKGPLWSRVLSLLGKGGDLIMIELLSDCGVFSPIHEQLGNYFQLSGPLMSELKQDQTGPKEQPANAAPPNSATRKPSNLVSENRSPNTITFVRSRMLYAPPALNARGRVRFGMRHIHVLNRFPIRSDEQQTIHIMRYIFPRQFGHHNVFTSKVNIRESAMPFKDYTMREKDINQNMCVQLGNIAPNEEAKAKWKSRVPKRLRGDPIALVNRLRTLHYRCSYVEMLRHYCPVEGLLSSPKPGSRKNTNQPPGEAVPAAAALAAEDEELADTPKSNHATAEETSFMDRACPTAHVSAFCRAVVARVIPNAFWGDENNKRIIMYWIDQFVSLRRFESLTLHQVTQKIQITRLAWLQIPGTNMSTKLAKTDYDRRTEIFLEFVYWLFDSFLVPLIRTNFHVTESNVHRNRLFYFRHDVWRKLTEPALANLRSTMFEDMPVDRVTRLLSARPLGFSKIRLLPKRAGVRLIMNLKRRQQVKRNGFVTLNRSINSVMAPVFNAITYEKSLQPEKFGSSLFSVGDMLPKLIAFKKSLEELGLKDEPLYFAKVDVQSCFDTIPQKRLVSMIDSLMSLEVYRTGKHVEIGPLEKLQQLDGHHVNPMPFKRYVGHSTDVSEIASFDQLVRDKLVGDKTNTVFVETAVHRLETKDDLMRLLREHVERNLVKMGKCFYRQKTGIPQGSVLSTILCNFFYAELERDVLSFALGDESVLLRLLDDFCLITTNREHAERFIRTMHRGHPDYGVTVKVAKSLTNFEVLTDDGNRVPQIISGDKFPYCGVLVDTQTLDVSKRSERGNVQDSLTVDLSKVPGQTFHRKALNGFKIQLQAMLIDTSLNSVPTVLANLYQRFHEAAVRCLEYSRTLAKVRTVHSRLLITTVDSMIALGYVMLQRRSRKRARENEARVRQEVSRRQVQWLACQAFIDVFQGRQQRQQRGLVAWLEKSLAAVRPSQRRERWMLADAIVAGHAQRGCGSDGRLK